MEKQQKKVEALTDTVDHLTKAERSWCPALGQDGRPYYNKIREARDAFRELLRDALVPAISDELMGIPKGPVGFFETVRMDTAEFRSDLLDRAIELDGLDSPLAANAARALAEVIDRQAQFKASETKREARNRALVKAADESDKAAQAA